MESQLCPPSSVFKSDREVKVAGCGWRKEQEATAQRAAYPLTLTGVHTSWGGKAKGHRLHRAGSDTD